MGTMLMSSPMFVVIHEKFFGAQQNGILLNFRRPIFGPTFIHFPLGRAATVCVPSTEIQSWLSVAQCNRVKSSPPVSMGIFGSFRSRTERVNPHQRERERESSKESESFRERENASPSFTFCNSLFTTKRWCASQGWNFE